MVVNMLLQQGYTLDYISSLDAYGMMLHLGCTLYNAPGKEDEDDG